ncbi:hypothetical protein AB0M44_28445 [Streptosporangium subroseum]|uniref:hypothetical protein n=1 Tax=Streptosporangium subroseum TaxID=106412 RepID=UPI0034325659
MAKVEPSKPSYTGPAVPGLEPQPLWAKGSGIVNLAMGVGKSIAYVRADIPGSALVVVDTASSRELANIPLSVSQEGLIPSSPKFRRDSVKGKPVAVLRYTRNVPASGMQSEHEQTMDLVVGEDGGVVWQSPSGGSDFFEGGYIVEADVRSAGAFVNGSGPDEGNLSRLVSIKDGSDREIVKLAAGGYPTDDTLYQVVGDTAIMTFSEGIIEGKGVKAIDLQQGGRTAWELKDSEVLGVFGSTLVTLRRTPISSWQGEYFLEFHEVKTGKANGVIKNPPNFDCHTSVYDPGNGVALCASNRTTNPPVTALDVHSGKIAWQQPGPHPRDLEPVLAAGGTAYFLAKPEFGDEGTAYVAVDSRNGNVLSDSLTVAPVAVSDDGISLMHEGRMLYGFRLK